MTDEQRAHEFALEIVKMFYQSNADKFETDPDGTIVIPIEILVAEYEAAFNRMTRG